MCCFNVGMIIIPLWLAKLFSLDLIPDILIIDTYMRVYMCTCICSITNSYSNNIMVKLLMIVVVLKDDLLYIVAPACYNLLLTHY
jgi:hypothetical protein